ncbi:uncharacterized protein LY89DRAFT_735813 [Mollisia scopiformis]|uniref:Methyltransferase domain-containing protein n=1 Tax=Mollisia scopiformis TaxID=149040 RepID=A0A194X3J2_MOLSC|nr:uncharacterized protein LY89DRAFT_735813 [Mollisia scopiformis]KUJ14736.1 hypothetical protein LY89DRAFT_735813 [Mollisia scopiformis]
MPSDASEQESYVFRQRDETESSRLNFQHTIALKVSQGHLIHPSIDISSLKAVADIGTGTGIWLEDLQQQVHSQTRLDGFDISAAQFPSASKCTYQVHNILEPFAPEYHGLYDLVHIRNMVESGGYLQWEDFDFERIVTTGAASPTHAELISLTCSFFTGLGMSLNCSIRVEETMKQAGLADAIREQRNSYWDKSLDSDTKNWCWQSFGGFIPKAVLWSGKAKDEETAERMINEKLQVLGKEYQSGAVPNFAQRVIVGRKA